MTDNHPGLFDQKILRILGDFLRKINAAEKKSPHQAVRDVAPALVVKIHSEET